MLQSVGNRTTHGNNHRGGMAPCAHNHPGGADPGADRSERRLKEFIVLMICEQDMRFSEAMASSVSNIYTLLFTLKMSTPSNVYASASASLLGRLDRRNV